MIPYLAEFKSSSIGFCTGEYRSTAGLIPRKFYKLNTELNRLLKNSSYESTMIHCYPNPAKDFVAINGNDLAQIILTDLQGKVLIHQEYTATTKSINLDLSLFKKGMYLLKIFDVSGKVTTEKIFKN